MNQPFGSFTPTVANDGWSCDFTVVELVLDDCPFIVDSKILGTREIGRTLILVIHPIVGTLAV